MNNPNMIYGIEVVNVGFKTLHPDARMPTYGSNEAAGADLYAIDLALLHPQSRLIIRTGIAIELPVGFEAQVRPRSGLALKHGITVLNTPGTIDSDYRGEIGVVLYNSDEIAFQINPGDRIAQLVIAPVFRANFNRVFELSSTARGVGGYGSTGTK